ncbi:hypothetical protein FH972_024474 [Carpinus fangiana]|uniref:NACHT domain-containing protein n=1 Tax=Carpinus fangiana TaxID=176857 RepID=A0A5N6KY45_9ROSI|nr:hypothetical protein FH972_024474 [Carpinus fangiana]
MPQQWKWLRRSKVKDGEPGSSVDHSSQSQAIPIDVTHVEKKRISPKPEGDVETLMKIPSLWLEAYENLRQTNPDLLLRFEQILQRESIHTSGILNDSKNLKYFQEGISGENALLLLDRKIQAIENKHKYSTYYDRAINVVLASKDFISSIASQEPHAALAWAGVSIILPLLLNPSQQRSDVLSGAQEVNDVLCRYRLRHATISKSNDAKAQEAWVAYFKNAVKLYTLILEFQARAVCQFSRHRIAQYGRDVFKADDWSGLSSSITTMDGSCTRLWEQLADSRVIQAEAQMKADLRVLLDDIQTRKTDSLKKEEQNRNFLDWRDENSSQLLWVSADPGCGKSVLSKTLVDEQLLGADSATTNLCYFFFKDNSKDNRSITRALSSLLHQAFNHNGKLLRHAIDEFQKSGPEISSSFSLLWQIFENVLSDDDAKDFVFLLDAFDECEESGRALLINKMSRMFSTANLSNKIDQPGPKFLITSRPYIDIGRDFTLFLEDKVMIELSGMNNTKAITDEICLVIEERVTKVTKELRLDFKASSALKHGLLQPMNKTYLWLSLVFEALEKSIGISTKHAIERFVSQIPKSVDEAYDALLNRSVNKQKAARLLSIVVAAYRPLTVRELNIAMEMDNTVESEEELEDRLETEENFRLTATNLCGLFISIVDSRVLLIHQTAKEFLIGKKSSLPNTKTWKDSLTLEDANIVVGEACVRYLLVIGADKPVKHEHPTPGIRANPNSKVQFYNNTDHFYETTFFAYAGSNWGEHIFGKGEVELVNLVNQLLLFRESHTKYPRLQLNYGSSPNDESFSGLHVIAYFGLVRILSKCVANGIVQHSQLDAVDIQGDTPLIIAAREGREDIVRFLLKLHRTPVDGSLMRLAGGKQDTATSLLPQSWIDVNHQNLYSEAALHVAVRFSHLEIVKILLANDDIDSNIRNERGHTPLYLAAYLDKTELLSVLITDKDVDINCEAINEYTPLMVASEHGDLEVVTLLLSRPALDIHKTNSSQNISAIACAEYNGHEDIVDLLVKHGADRSSVKPMTDDVALYYACCRRQWDEAGALITAMDGSIDINQRHGTNDDSTLAILAIELFTGSPDDPDDCTKVLELLERLMPHVAHLPTEFGISPNTLLLIAAMYGSLVTAECAVMAECAIRLGPRANPASISGKLLHDAEDTARYWETREPCASRPRNKTVDGKDAVLSLIQSVLDGTWAGLKVDEANGDEDSGQNIDKPVNNVLEEKVP